MKYQFVIQHITNWLSDYATKARAKGFVVGISGGIDSAVVSALAARTRLDVLLLEMPIRQKTDQIDRAQEHIADLQSKFDNVRAMRVDLTPAFEAFEKTVNVDAADYPARDLAFANSRARLRMLTLYYYGQINQLLVAGTGNKVEDFGVGFFTKYGDGGVDISPIGDLLKTQVYGLAKELNIVDSIQRAIPTDGLWDEERTDEQQMGASYPELEWAMSVYDSHKPEDFQGRKREVLEIYTRLHKAMQHKVQPIPVCKIPEELLG
ncbi:NAD(+) synthase [Neisseria sp. 83E34]|uniref:NAD(+) synthase n=1 Tax=Neisseria sp. 83E34 TaxID=1692264 RepID=UPI0006CE968F|nr:NAD(+) synthase [Neisseria sp. 83E34]KPN70987.1 NAD synthetase [Neisseria sp. 83E34]